MNGKTTEFVNKGQSKYEKGGTAGIEGILFQVNLQTVVLLNAFQNFKGWKLSTENKCYGKFDDVVLELPDGAILLQAKHRKNKKLLFNELFSVNSKNVDFSLGKYFFSYLEIKARVQVKYVVICTNSEIKGCNGMQKFFNKERDTCESILYHFDDHSFYTFNDSFLPKLEEHVRSYYIENLQGKNIDEAIITSENLNDFLNHLKLYCNYPSEEKLNSIIEQLFTQIEGARDLCRETSSKYIHNKMLDWFRQPKGIHLEDCHVKAMIAEMRSSRYCETLEKYNVVFHDTKSVFNDAKKILHVISKDWYLLNVLKIYRALQSNNKKITQILYVSSDDSAYLENFVEAFELPQYTHLIIIRPELEEEGKIKKLNTKLREILNRSLYKKVILIANSNNKLALEISQNNDTYEATEESITLKNLSTDTQSRLLKFKNVIFQGKCISLEELFSTEILDTSEENSEQQDLNRVQDTCDKTTDPDTLEKLIKSEKITIGSRLEPLDEDIKHCYIHRKFKREIGKTELKKEEILSEENIYNLKEKTILLVDSAGMGKSTVLTNLAVAIKKKLPHLWVIRINLNDYTAVLKKFLTENKKTITLIDMLQSVDATKLTSRFEQTIFSTNHRVVLMLDGVDEISPDYTELVLNLLLECQKSPNFAKVFSTARLHMAEALEETLTTKPFRLQPFTDQNQSDFLTNHWMHDLQLDETNRTKCEEYAEALISKMAVWKEFSEIPLHVNMLAEVFKTSTQMGESDWEGCLEFLNGNKEQPKLPKMLNVTNLYGLFIKRKQDIFMNKGNPIGNAAANQALCKEFDDCLAYHRTLGLKEILSENDSKLFSCYQGDVEKSIETSMLKIGIVQKMDKDFHFLHRTFAEYFVAQSVLLELQEQKARPNKKFQRFFVEHILTCATFNVIRMFLDSFIRNATDSLPRNILRKYQCLTFKYRYKDPYPLILIHLLAQEGWVGILEFILKCIKFKIVKNKVTKIPSIYNISFMFKAPKLFFSTSLYILKYLVQQGGVNIIDRNGNSPLHYAVQGAHFQMVKFLVEQGANVNKGDNTGRSPLWIAVSLRRLDLIEYLIANGADINKKNKNGETVLSFTAVIRLWSTFKLLVQRGADLTVRDDRGYTILQRILWENHIDIFNFLVGHGAITSDVKRYLPRALHFAAAFGHLKDVQSLVEYGVDVNFGVNVRFTALHAAAERGHFDVVEFLINKCHAKVNVANIEGITALHLAALAGHLDIVKILVENGAEVDVKSVDGETVMQFAVKNDHWEVVRFLKQMSAAKDGQVNLTNL